MENPELYLRLSNHITANDGELIDVFAEFYLMEMLKFIQFDKNDDSIIDKTAVFSYSTSVVNVGREVLDTETMKGFVTRFLSGILFTLTRLIDNKIQFDYEQ
jgi:hypothetical protein